MKRSQMVGILIGAAVLFAASMTMAQPMGPGMMGPGYGYGYGPGPGYGYGPGGSYGDWSCPYRGGPMGPGYGMGPGMMGPGYGMGPGMMGRGYGYGYGPGPGYGPGYGMGPGMMGRGWGPAPNQGRQYEEPAKPLEEKDAMEMVENYLKSTWGKSRTWMDTSR
jgi:hypothetical protein